MDLNIYKEEVSTELTDILSYWVNHTIDWERGGFFGKINNENQPESHSIKGSVLNSRILWAFSAAYIQTKNQDYLVLAKRAFEYIQEYFLDKKYGGVYWSADHTGSNPNGRKQIYALAFCLYGMSEYFKAAKEAQALETAIDLFNTIEKYSFDKKKLGYFEAFTRDWHVLDDLRLSEKDENEKKTMNTHLHIVEAYANLYEVWPNGFLKVQIENLLGVFIKHIIDPKSYHLKLFFDEDWKSKSDLVSYGHDIEAAWLLQQCAEKIKNKDFIESLKNISQKITLATMEGLDLDGGLWYELDPTKNNLIKEKHSWPQAEAMIGFMNAYQISQDNSYLEKSIQSWDFIKKHIKDKKKGEWFWGVNADYTIMEGQDKVGFWKCPYHNTRACLEIMNRIP